MEISHGCYLVVIKYKSVRVSSRFTFIESSLSRRHNFDLSDRLDYTITHRINYTLYNIATIVLPFVVRTYDVTFHPSSTVWELSSHDTWLDFTRARVKAGNLAARKHLPPVEPNHPTIEFHVCRMSCVQ